MIETRFSTDKGARCAIALGWFDGMHKGHVALVEKTVETARENGLCAAVWTFTGSKKAGSGNSPGFILPDGEKAEMLRSLGADVVYSAGLDEVRDLTPEEFVKDTVIGRCGADVALCGFNYRFGAGGAGTADDLTSLMRSFGKDAVTVPPVVSGGETVSSTAVRGYLTGGRPDRAAELLGRPFSLKSAVAHGRRIGHKLGIPTLNQSFPEGSLVPKYGVYVTNVTVDGVSFRAVSNVGVRPTFGEGGPAVCESNIIAGDPGECYGRTVKTEFLFFLRSERRFDSEELLKAQIADDISNAKKY